MNLNELPWIILFLPLGAAVVITLFTQGAPRRSAALSISAVALGFILSILYVSAAGWEPPTSTAAADWLSVGCLRVDFGLKLDPLSLLMMLVVTGVASAIHI